MSKSYFNFMQSHIYIGGHPDATNAIILDNNIVDMMRNAGGDIFFTEYEITETDRRTKTAKFTTPHYFDLTSNFTFLIITSPFHEDFGGVVLSVTYDKSTGLYTYQCQDWRRQFSSKNRTVGSNAIIYDVLESLIVKPYMSPNDYISFPISDSVRKQYARALSGLHPLNDYYVQASPYITPDNYLSRRADFLGVDTGINRIFNLALYHQNNLDIYFDKYGIIHLDPLDMDSWLNTGIHLVHNDIVHYKYGFDTTNILTSVYVQRGDNGTPHRFDDALSLSVFFGSNSTILNAPQSNTKSTNNNNVSPTTTTLNYNSCGVSTDADKSKVMAIGLPSASGEINKYGYNWYKSVFKNKCPFCGRKTLVWDWNFGSYSSCSGAYEGGTAEGHIYCSTKLGGCDADFSCIDGKDHSYTPRDSLTRVSGPDRSSRDEAIKLKNGQMSVTTTNVAPTTDNSTTTEDYDSQDYIFKQYRLALKEFSKSLRELLSFEIRIPLNDPMFKNLHTNSFLFTELPPEFALKNFGKIAKTLGGLSADNRGVPYLANRWYIEGIKIKCNSDGLFADITLNPFPSGYSTYASAMEGYISAYDSAFNSSSDSTTVGNTTVNKTNTRVPERTDGCTDCSSSMAIACNTSWASIGSQQNRVESERAYGRIGRTGTNYANYVAGCTPREAYKKLAKKFNYGSYIGYNDNRDRCASDTFSKGTYNCGDGARLLKACMDVLDQPCVIYCVPGHYMNGVLINGRWETVDLCYQSGARPEYQTAGWNR